MAEKQKVTWDQEIIFTNWTDEDFEGVWDKKIYPLPSKKSFYLPFYLAEHFAKHLVDRELNKMKLATNHHSRQELMDKCVTIIPVKPEDVNVVRSKEVKMKEAVLHRDTRNKEFEEKTGVPSQVNRKALKQAEDQAKDFE